MCWFIPHRCGADSAPSARQRLHGFVERLEGRVLLHGGVADAPTAAPAAAAATVPAVMMPKFVEPTASPVAVRRAHRSHRQASLALAVSAEAVGTTGLRLEWPATGSKGPRRRYRITYTPGAYVPGAAGGPQSVVVPAAAGSAELTGLQPFTLYTIDLAVAGRGHRRAAAHLTAWTAAPATQRRYLYAVELPSDRPGFTALQPHVDVFDIDAGNQWVRSIPLPAGVYNARGVAACAATGRLYVSFRETPEDAYTPGGLLCLDLTTGAVIWRRDYDPAVIPSPDRFDITPDGEKIYMPVGENGAADYWAVIDAATGLPTGAVVHHTTSAHNTIVGLDGRYAYLEGQEKSPEPAAVTHTIAIVDTATDTVVQRVGPFRDVVRPFTVNGAGTLLFANVNNFVGFQVADVAKGKVIYTAAPPGYAQPAPAPGESPSHGIALTPDERQVWVADGLRHGLHVWDVSGLPARPPRYLGFVPTRSPGADLAGQPDPAAANDPDRAPYWVTTSYDGKYVYAETGEVIDTTTLQVVGQLRSGGPGGLYVHSRFMLEVDFDGGAPVRATDQFGVGRVR